jgi:two-component system, NarL family, response regulator NreC
MPDNYSPGRNGPATSEQKISLLVVDDHPLLLAGLCMLLNAEKDLEVVGQADNALEAMRLAREKKPQIILLDITLQETSGLDLLPAIREACPDSRVIMLTMHEDQQYMQKAIQTGAAGFVLKKGLDVDLLYAIRAVMRGEMFIQPSMLKDYLQPSAKPPLSKEPPPDKDAVLWNSLSAREREVMAEVARGYTSKEIGEKLFLSEKTVATYRSRAMFKLGLETRAELIELALKIGLLPQR